MTTVLHVTATPSFELALWAEELAASHSGWRFAPDDTLRDAVAKLFPSEPLPATPSIPDLRIAWPAAGLEPTPSPTLRQFLLFRGAPRRLFEPDRLAVSHVAGLKVPAAVVRQLSSPDRPLQLHLAADAAFWAMVVSDALALVASGRFVPRLAAVPGGAAFRWMPLIEYGSELARVNDLIGALPDVARAGAADVAPRQIVTEVLTGLVDGLVRGSTTPRRKPALAGASLQTWQALTKTGPQVVLPPAVIEQLGAAGTEAALPARVTFRVTPASEAPWTIEFLLQDRHDPSVLVPAAAVWARNAAPSSISPPTGMMPRSCCCAASPELGASRPPSGVPSTSRLRSVRAALWTKPTTSYGTTCRTWSCWASACCCRRGGGGAAAAGKSGCAAGLGHRRLRPLRREDSVRTAWWSSTGRWR